MNIDTKQYYEVVPLSSGELPQDDEEYFVIIDNGKRMIKDSYAYGGWSIELISHDQVEVTAWLRPVSLTEIIKEVAGKEDVFIPCHEDDNDKCGNYTSLDGRSLCYVKILK